MSIPQARALLPKNSIIGVSCNNVQQVKKARQDLVDYVGIGAVWGTKTKTLTNPIIGVRGVGKILEVLDGTNIKTVAIGMFLLRREFYCFIVHFIRGHQGEQSFENASWNSFVNRAYP